MSKQIEAMKLALERLQARTDTADLDAIAALNEALAEQPAQQEPVAMRDAIVVNLVREGINKHRARELADHFIGLATPQPPAQPLTDEQVIKTFNAICNGKPFSVERILELHRAIEAAHGITKGNT